MIVNTVEETLVLATLYLLAPLFHQRVKAYQNGESWFGTTPFKFEAGIGAFYVVYLIVGLILFGGLIVGGIAFGGAVAALIAMSGDSAPPNPAQFMPIVVGLIVLIVALSLIVGPQFQARIGNLVWNGTRLGDHRFDNRLRVMPLFWITLTNFVLVALTLGLFIPWAAVRVARYRAECLSLVPASALDAFIADTSAEVAATGEEAAEMFDFDMGL